MTVEIRELSSVEDVRAAASLIERIWREPRVITAELLRAMATHGNLVLGAFREGEMVGAQMAFLGMEEGRTILHSHVTGITADAQHHGIGFLLKRAQREWAVRRGIGVVTWTFDPMIARNAYFNIVKLGAVADRFLRDFYGPMDDAFNAGERSDRLEARWHVADPRVERIMAGRRPDGPADGEPLLENVAGAPRIRRDAGDGPLIVETPPDYLRLRTDDPELARAWRDAVADALEHALSAGFRVTGFVRDRGYVLERA